MSAKKIRRSPKAIHKGWSAHCGCLWSTKREANADARRGGLDKGYPVLLLDLRPEARERIVEVIRMATGMAINTGKGWSKNTRPYESIARAILSALAGEKGKKEAR